MNKNQYFIYARKSTDDTSRQIRSIGDQYAELRLLARKEDLVVIREFEERQSAKKLGRPIFNDMLARIERGEADGILAWHPDRLARNSVDGGRVIDMLDRNVLKDLKFPTFRFENTAQGKFMLSIMFSQSKYQVDSMAENISRGHRQKVMNGIWPQMAPLGYLNERATKTLVVDPSTAPLIQKAFELYATGKYTFARVREVINELGLLSHRGQPLSVSNFQNILRNPFYHGVIRYLEELHEARHEPLITKGLFDRCQEVMKQKSKPKAPKLKAYLYRGFFRCGECGCFITTETQKGHNYLRCTKRVKKDCSQPYVREECVSGQIDDALRSFSLPLERADFFISSLETEREQSTHAAEEAEALHRKRIAETDEKLNRLTDAYLDQAVSLNDFKEVKSKLVLQKQGFKDELAAQQKTRSSWFEPAIRFVKASKQAGFLASSGSETEKRDFLRKTGSNLTLENRHLRVSPRGAWQFVVNQGVLAQDKTPASLGRGGFSGEAHPLHTEAERAGVELAQIRNLLLRLYLHLKIGNPKELARLVDVLSLHGFLLSRDAP